jgi:hypothetical protein
MRPGAEQAALSCLREGESVAQTKEEPAVGPLKEILCQKPKNREWLELVDRHLDEFLEDSSGQTLGMGIAEKYLWVRPRGGRSILLKANLMQKEFESRRGAQNIVLKARQLGMTTWAAARFFLKTITRPGTLTLEVAHSQESAEEIFRIVHRFLDKLPEELRKGPLKTSRANVRQIVFPEMDSQYRVVTAGDRNAGRGLTVQNLHCSELARWPGDPAETLAGLRAALTLGAELILESTPKGKGGCFHEEWEKADEMGMVRHFFPWWMEEHYRARAVDQSSLSEEELKLMERHKLTPEQIGFRRKVRTDFRGLARQEYAEDPESCFLASRDSIFELDVIEARLPEAPEPVDQRNNGELEIWLPPLKGKEYIVAVDPAGGGTDGDYSAIEVLELETSLQCAEFAGHVGGLELAKLATNLAREYNQAWLVVERNNIGSAVLAYLDTVCNYDRVYKQSEEPGWLTTSVSRPAALGRLGAALVEKPGHFQSRKLLAECRSFVRLPNGSTGAQPGTHDDRVMAMAIALAARAEIVVKGSR